MLTVDVSPSLPALEKMLGPELAKQARFALALSLTHTAGDARKRLIGGLPAYFTVRSKFVASTMQTTRATKQGLTAIVGSVQRVGSSLDMSIHATGGQKVAKDGGRVGVPLGARRTPTSKTTKSQFPSKMLKRRKYFKQTVNGKLGIWRRTTKKRYPIKLMWLLEPEVEIRPDWPFEKQVQKAVLLDWSRRLHAALDRAIKTRKR